jgi:hypothetical protein
MGAHININDESRTATDLEPFIHDEIETVRMSEILQNYT